MPDNYDYFLLLFSDAYFIIAPLAWADNMGWYTGGKVEFEVDGQKMWGQIGINLTVMGSKEWKK